MSTGGGLHPARRYKRRTMGRWNFKKKTVQKMGGKPSKKPSKKNCANFPSLHHAHPPIHLVVHEPSTHLVGRGVAWEQKQKPLQGALINLTLSGGGGHPWGRRKTSFGCHSDRWSKAQTKWWAKFCQQYFSAPEKLKQKTPFWGNIMQI